MIQIPLKTLYDADFALWVEGTLAKLKAKEFNQIDWENLIEEIESLGGRDRRELESRLTTLFEHALKRCFVPLPDCYRGWENTMKRNQKELKKILRDSPSLGNYCLAMFNECYADAVDNIRDEYDVTFPDVCPFPQVVEVLLTEKFWEI